MEAQVHAYGQSSGTSPEWGQPLAATSPDPSTSQPGPLEPTQQSSGVRSPTEKEDSKKYTEPQMPLRPGFGLSGHQGNVLANHFKVTVEPQLQTIFQYDVDIVRMSEITEEPINEPNKLLKKEKPPQREVCRKILIKTHKEDLWESSMGYDGRKTLYTTQKLNFEDKDFNVQITDDFDGYQMSFTVSIQLVATMQLKDLDTFMDPSQGVYVEKPQNLIQALDVAMSESKWAENYTGSAGSFFSRELGSGEKDYLKQLSWGMESWKGISQSLRITGQGLALIVNNTNGAFFIDGTTVADYIYYLIGNTKEAPPFPNYPEDRERYKKLVKQLSGVRVRVKEVYDEKHEEIQMKRLIRENVKGKGKGKEATERWTEEQKKRGYKWRRYTIDCLVGSAAEETFAYNGRMITVQHYFETRYVHTKLKFPEFPCVRARSLQALIPSELCLIEQQRNNKPNLCEKQMKGMITAACIPPTQRRMRIHNLMLMETGSPGSVPEGWGLKVEKQMTKLQARILENPTLKSGKDSKIIIPQNGAWSLKDAHVTLPAQPITSWLLINFDPNFPAENFINQLVARCSRLHITLAPKPVLPLDATRIHPNLLNNYKELYKEMSRINDLALKQGSLQLLISIFPKISLHGRNFFKHICDFRLGLFSQCCLSEKIHNSAKRQDQLQQYLGNLALKINVKVDGANISLSSPLNLTYPSSLGAHTPYILLGADVCHAGGKNDPSIAAVVGTTDWPNNLRYAARISKQAPKQEIIDDLKNMVAELLRLFKEQNRNKFPEKVIMFRDGVSEGQFKEVLKTELRMLREAIEQEAPPGASPQITWVVVQKRHQTRLFPADGENEIRDGKGNVVPGVVVDHTITHPFEFDFYLVSHAAIQGTSKPTHYYVLSDENKFSSDDMQNICNSLCYTYARCARSVSIVPPAFYAHLAATRGRLYYDTEVVAHDQFNDPARHGSFSNTLHPRIKNTMFFC